MLLCWLLCYPVYTVLPGTQKQKPRTTLTHTYIAYMAILIWVYLTTPRLGLETVVNHRRFGIWKARFYSYISGNKRKVRFCARTCADTYLQIVGSIALFSKLTSSFSGQTGSPVANMVPYYYILRKFTTKFHIYSQMISCKY